MLTEWDHGVLKCVAFKNRPSSVATLNTGWSGVKHTAIGLWQPLRTNPGLAKCMVPTVLARIVPTVKLTGLLFMVWARPVVPVKGIF
uniref:Uncharacterized protein n=1 Tax=Anguilla anguilla TaxID=7936 RepID=A0A0E9T2Q8_ANGAN